MSHHVWKVAGQFGHQFCAWLARECFVYIMPPRSPVSECEIAMVLSAITFFTLEGEVKGDKRYPVYDKVSKCLGVSKVTVKRIGAASKENSGDASPGSRRKKLCTSSERGRPSLKLDEFTLGTIRRTIHDFYLNKLYPTIDSLHQKLKENMTDFPQMSKSSVLKIVKKLGFRFKKLNTKPVLMESMIVAASRHTFLRKMKELRSNGYKLFFTDETWCGQNHTMSYGWQENVVESLNKNFNNYDQYRGHIQQIYGWRGGFKTPSGAGKRIIILHIGSEDGFLPGAQLCFIGKKNTGDYHNEMNSTHFEEWFRKVLTLLPEKSAIILDQAPYHTMTDPTTRNPNIKWRKNEIISWVLNKNIPLPQNTTTFEQMTKAELIVFSRPYFRSPIKRLEKIKDELRPDVELVWLPVAHCELNPIELVWAYVKNKVAKVNMSNAAENGRSMQVMNTLCQEALRSVTPELWKSCISHAKKIEDYYWEKDQMIDDIPIVQQMVINLAESSESSEDPESSDEEEFY